MNANPHVNLTVTIVVRCRFIGCDWSMEIGQAPLDAHNAYLDHLDVHDIETLECGCPTSGIQSHGCTAPDSHRPDPQGGLYVGDTPEEIAGGQATVDRFMAGGGDQ